MAHSAAMGNIDHVIQYLTMCASYVELITMRLPTADPIQAQALFPHTSHLLRAVIRVRVRVRVRVPQPLMYYVQ